MAANLTNLAGIWSDKSAWTRATDAVEHAFALNPDLAQAHSMLATIRRHNLDWRGAAESTKRALELAPGDAAVVRRAALAAHFQGYFEEATQYNLRALQLDPLSASANASLGHMYFSQGRLSDAEAALRRTLELSPQRAGTHAVLALTLLGQGRSQEAIAESEQEAMPQFRLWAEAIIQHELGHPSESQWALDQLIERHGTESLAQIAQVYAARGEKDEAFAWLDRAIEQGDAMELKPARYLRSLHTDPRWGAFLKKMGLDES